MGQNKKQTKNSGEGENTRDIDQLAFIGTLAEGLAQEIRNPLSTINVNVQLLEEDWEQPETDRERSSYKRIKELSKQTEHLENILNKFLQFARGLELQLEDIDLNTFLDELLDTLSPQLQEENIELQRNLSSGIPLVSIDREHFKRALMNLFENAVDAMKNQEEGHIIVETEETEDGTVQLTITDSGPGIADDQMERVFDVFYSTRKGNTGLGLPITRRIVQEHGGVVSMENSSSHGTDVFIDLPPAQSERTVES